MTHAIVQMDFHILSLNKIIVINMYLIFCTNSLVMEAKQENFDSLMQQALRMWQSDEQNDLWILDMSASSWTPHEACATGRLSERYYFPSTLACKSSSHDPKNYSYCLITSV